MIGKRKARKKRRISNEDGTRESTTFVPAEEDKGEQTIETKKQVEQVECQSGKFDLTVIQDALRAERHEHTYQTQERKLRAANIIIHGLNEGTEIDDQIEIKKIFKAVGVTSLPKSFTRLGSQSTHARGRPVKLVMNNLQEKKIFMNNLPKLKTAEENIRRISITHDFTLEQRKINAAMVKKAREMTSNNNQDEWKLRGSPLG